MSIQFEEFTDHHIPLVKEFNQRLFEHTREFHFPESPVSSWLPYQEGKPVYERLFVGLENGVMRGGYVLKFQDFFMNGDKKVIIDLRLPISEGIVNPKYTMMGVLVLKDAIKRFPLQYVLGMGGWQQPITKLVKASKWCLKEVPFYFRIFHPYAFLRKNAFLRKSFKKRFLLDILAYTGLGFVGIHSVFAFKKIQYNTTLNKNQNYEYEELTEWGDWVDEIWEEGSRNYVLSAVRNREMLEILYPLSNPRFRMLCITRNGKKIGWAVVLVTSMKNHKQFGSLRVGTLVDCFAIPNEETCVADCVTNFIQKENADIAITNQFHQSWVQAMVVNGYLQGPSNFIFGVSPEMVKLLTPLETTNHQIHMNRGDGDGPIHL